MGKGKTKLLLLIIEVRPPVAEKLVCSAWTYSFSAAR